MEHGSQLRPGTRNRRLFAAACDLLGCGYSDAEIRALLAPIARGSGLPHDEIERTLQSAVSKKRTAARPKDSNTFTPRSLDWQYAQAYVRTAEWPGRTGSSDRVVALALVERARLGSHEDGTFRASLRELGVLARRSNRQTISASLKRLQKRRFIVKGPGRDKLSEASLWQFHPDMLQQGRQAVESGLCETEPLQLSSGAGYVFGSSTNGYTNGSLSHTSTDAVERGALGVEGLMVYQAMIACDAPVLPGALARVTQLSLNQVRYRLRGLRKYQLVERRSEGWVVTCILDAQGLDECVAAPAGTLGKGEHRKRRAEDDRAQYAASLILHWRALYDRPNFPLVVHACSHCHYQSWRYPDQLLEACPRCGSTS